MNGEGADAAKSDANGSANKKSSPGGGLRNFRMDKEDTAKGQMSLLRYFRNEGKKSAKLPAKDKSDTESPKSTSPVLKSRQSHNKSLDSPTANDAGSQIIKTTSSVKKSVATISVHTTTSLPDLDAKNSSKTVIGESDDELDNGCERDTSEETSPVIQRKTVRVMEVSNGTSPSSPSSSSTSTASRLEEKKAPIRLSKPLFVQPPSPDQKDYDAETDDEDGPPTSSDNPLGGVPMKVLINSLSPSKSVSSTSMDQDQDSQDGIFIRVKPAKRARLVVSDDDDDDAIKPPTKKMQLNGHSDSDRITGEDDEKIEQYIETFESLYPKIEKMEMMDVFRKNEWDAQLTIRDLDKLEKERKLKFLQEQRLKREEERNSKNSERELQQMKKNAKKERVKAQKESWKAKAAARIEEQDMEEEEEDYNFGGSKVYDSDADSDTEPDTQMTTDRQLVLQFFNEGSVGELAAISGCSKKKAEVVAQIRPFKDWKDIIEKFQTEKYVSTDLLNEAKTILHVRNTVQKLMKKCENIAKEMQTIVSRIVSGEEDAGISKQPSIMNMTLQMKSYQLIGLNWLVLMHQQGLNGVLADEMGLGKTVQAISFLAYIKEVEEPDEISLIVVPSSTLDNWARELEFWCPALSVLQYHGTQEERRGIRIDIMNDNLEETPDVILTTYTMVTTSTEDRALFKKLRFHTIVLDEAHMLKNMASQRYENLMKIKGQRRVLLTGTPLQNNLVELMSILIFVMPQLFDSKKEELKRVFSMFPKSDDSGNKGKFERERIEQAKRIMKPFFLRRLKCDVLKDLPKKTDEVRYAPMSKRQQKIYTETVEAFSRKARQNQIEIEQMNMKNLTELEELEAIGKSPTKSSDLDSSSNMVMTLRKIANHPLLTRKYYDDSKLREISKVLKKTSHRESVLEYIVEDFSVMSDFEIHSTCLMYPAVRKYQMPDELILSSGKFEQLDEILPKLKKDGSRVLIFSQFVMMLDIIEKYVKIRGHKYRRFDGTTQVSERQELIDEFTENEDIFIFLLSTRAGGLGINLTAANTVILHDIDFNPYNDKQAEDRCHRVGQTKPVQIIRLLSKGSIEEGMLQIAQAKLQLERDVTGIGDEQHKKGDVVALLKAALGLAKAEAQSSSSSSGS